MVHRDGRPFTRAEQDPAFSATRREYETATDQINWEADYHRAYQEAVEALTRLLLPHFTQLPEVATVSGIVPLISDDDRAEYPRFRDTAAPDGCLYAPTDEQVARLPPAGRPSHQAGAERLGRLAGSQDHERTVSHSGADDDSGNEAEQVHGHHVANHLGLITTRSRTPYAEDARELRAPWADDGASPGGRGWPATGGSEPCCRHPSADRHASTPRGRW
jgi:hypothetical protein